MTRKEFKNFNLALSDFLDTNFIVFIKDKKGNLVGQFTITNNLHDFEIRRISITEDFRSFVTEIIKEVENIVGKKQRFIRDYREFGSPLGIYDFEVWRKPSFEVKEPVMSYMAKVEAKMKPFKAKKPDKAKKNQKPTKPVKNQKPIKPKMAKGQDEDVVNDTAVEKRDQVLHDKIQIKDSPNFIRLKMYLPNVYEGSKALDLTKAAQDKQWIIFLRDYGVEAFVHLLKDLGIIDSGKVRTLVNYLKPKVRG